MTTEQSEQSLEIQQVELLLFSLKESTVEIHNKSSEDG